MSTIIKPVHPKKYKTLKKGKIYIFESFTLQKDEDTHYFAPGIQRQGKLISVSAKWKEQRDKKGKIVSRELLGDRLVYEPLDNINEQQLRIYEIHICCGLFRIFEVEND
jgi:hypothetical protein